MIKLSEIAAGDQVVIQDRNSNVASGVVQAGDKALAVEVFGVMIRFARVDMKHRWVLVPGVRVVGHTPLLVVEL